MAEGGGKTTVHWVRTKDGIGGAAEAADDPIVGWLVATEGPAKGRDFRIYCGNNSVGRDPSCRIYIQDDTAIHRGIHMTIVFDPVDNQFYVVPNPQIKSLVRVETNAFAPSEPRNQEELYYDEESSRNQEMQPRNGAKLLLQAMKIEKYTVIHIGASKLTFVPFCNELFGWDIL
jgi:hypothetical protein